MASTATAQCLYYIEGQPSSTVAPGLSIQEAPTYAHYSRQRDTLHIYLNLTGTPAETEVLSQDLIELLSHHYYKTGGSVSSALRNAILEVHQRLAGHNVSKADTFREGAIACVVRRQNELFLARVGDVCVIWKRGEEVKLLPAFSRSQATLLGSADTLSVQLDHQRITQNTTLLMGDPHVAKLPLLQLAQWPQLVPNHFPNRNTRLLIAPFPYQKASPISTTKISSKVVQTPNQWQQFLGLHFAREKQWLTTGETFHIFKVGLKTTPPANKKTPSTSPLVKPSPQRPVSNKDVATKMPAFLPSSHLPQLTTNELRKWGLYLLIAVAVPLTLVLLAHFIFTKRATANQLAQPYPLAVELVKSSTPGMNGYPTLADLWQGNAEFVVDIEDTGLPMGESETLVMLNGALWSYVHASDRSAGTIDQCGNPVEFPGCTVIYRSADAGISFQHDNPPVCQFECNQCPCDSQIDQIDQQQYPDIAIYEGGMILVYEYRGRTFLRRSRDGTSWSNPEPVAHTGHWHLNWRPCQPEEMIGEHPFVPYDYECLVGAPPGIYIEGDMAYVFVALGQNPGHMGCLKGKVTQHAEEFVRCDNNPLFTGATEYGPIEERGVTTNPYFDFRTISSAEVLQVGDQYYMLYEGLRGPGPFDPGDTQFALGLARTVTGELDGVWEKYAGNPIIVDLPGNIGLGHADLVIMNGETILYTSLDGVQRSRLKLVWK